MYVMYVMYVSGQSARPECAARVRGQYCCQHFAMCAASTCQFQV